MLAQQVKITGQINFHWQHLLPPEMSIAIKLTNVIIMKL